MTFRPIGAAKGTDRRSRFGLPRVTPMAVEEQVRAYGGPRFQLTQSVMSQFAAAVQTAGVDLVPKIVISGCSGGGPDGGVAGGGAAGGDGGAMSSGVIQALLAMLLSEKIGADVTASNPVSPEVASVRAELAARLEATGVVPAESGGPANAGSGTGSGPARRPAMVRRHTGGASSVQDAAGR
jgi:hypothetical protein